MTILSQLFNQEIEQDILRVVERRGNRLQNAGERISAASIRQEDIDFARQWWRKIVDPEFALLLDAKLKI